MRLLSNAIEKGVENSKLRIPLPIPRHNIETLGLKAERRGRDAAITEQEQYSLKSIRSATSTSSKEEENLQAPFMTL